MIKIGLIDIDNSYLTRNFQYLSRFKNLKIEFCYNNKYIYDDNPIIDKDLDVLILDILTVKLEGVKCFQILFPNAKVIVVAQELVQDEILGAIKLGVASYILKTENPHEVYQTILTVFDGGKVLASPAARFVMDYLSLDNRKSDLDVLTKRELDFANELLNGLTYKAIADVLFVSTSTVNFHIQNIYSKLKVGSRSLFLAKYLVA
jgi:DNA-binding NarL/FixJ family response regulator